jgi:hypothetical protein
MDPVELAKQIAQAHADIEVRLTELRGQKEKINDEIKDLLAKQMALPVPRTKRAPRKKAPVAAAAE